MRFFAIAGLLALLAGGGARADGAGRHGPAQREDHHR